ncbi:MAG: thiamine-phosphate kinase [Hyphomonadaceae bacterium]|nr:thiamine-phosphate kinase [Hyphomonadaceae bacterium]
MSADEFEIIATCFAPLAQHKSARGLADDVALIEPTSALVVTTDAIVEGVHFLPTDPLDTVAKKAVRVNFSDLIAKGARPFGITLSLIWPRGRSATEIADFARGLGEDLRFYDAALLGGDTTSTPGPLTVSITAFGAPYGARTPSRADAQVGDQVWVTGVIGDGFLGLQSLTQAPDIIGANAGDQLDAHARAVRAAYRTPEPPLRFAEAIAAHAHASMDVSDGLVGDAEKLAAASGVAIRVDAESIPLSAAGHAYVSARGASGLAELITGGDDYQALFTAPASARSAIQSAARAASVDVALIGDVEQGAGVRVVGESGELHLASRGHRHRLGA